MHDEVGGRSASIAVVVPTWNGWPHTRACLGALMRCGDGLDVVVVDNGSTDGTPTHLAQWPDRSVRPLRLPRNAGFAGDMNAGLRWVLDRGYEYVWLLNNDVTFAPDIPDRLRRTIDSSARDIVISPALTGPDGRLQHVGGRWEPDGSANQLLTPDAFEACGDDGRWLTGTALFCRTDTARRIGAFDHRLFAYWEDIDWSMRARALGIGLAVAQDCRVIHDASQGLGSHRSPTATHLIARNEVLLVRTYQCDARRRRRALARVVARALRLAMLFERRGNAEGARALLGGLLAGLAGVTGRPHVVNVPRAVAALAMRRPLSAAHALERWAARP